MHRGKLSFLVYDEAKAWQATSVAPLEAGYGACDHYLRQAVTAFLGSASHLHPELHTVLLLLRASLDRATGQRERPRGRACEL